MDFDRLIFNASYTYVYIHIYKCRYVYIDATFLCRVSFCENGLQS